MLLLHFIQRKLFMVVLHFPMPYGISLPEKHCHISRRASAHQARRQRGSPSHLCLVRRSVLEIRRRRKGKTGHALACLLFAERKPAQQENWCHYSLSAER